MSLGILDDPLKRSRYRYCFGSVCPWSCAFLIRLRKCQRRNQRAGESYNCFLHYDASVLMLMNVLLSNFWRWFGLNKIHFVFLP